MRSDERAQAGVGGEHAVVAVTMTARWRNERGEVLEEFEGGELEHAPAVGTGPWQLVAQLLALARPR